jgi:hypothetical protein
MEKKKATIKSSPKKTPRKHKHIVALYHLYQAGYEGLNTFEAKKLYGDTCLHSVISTLVHEYDFQIPRRSEYVGEFPRPFARYWLCESDRAKAEPLLLAHYGEELQCA